MEYNCWVFHTVGPSHLIFALRISGWRRLRLPMQEDWGTMRQGITALHSLPGEVQRVVGRDEIQTRYVTENVFDSDVFSQCVSQGCVDNRHLWSNFEIQTLWPCQTSPTMCTSTNALLPEISTASTPSCFWRGLLLIASCHRTGLTNCWASVSQESMQVLDPLMSSGWMMRGPVSHRSSNVWYVRLIMSGWVYGSMPSWTLYSWLIESPNDCGLPFFQPHCPGTNSLLPSPISWHGREPTFWSKATAASWQKETFDLFGARAAAPQKIPKPVHTKICSISSATL